MTDDVGLTILICLQGFPRTWDTTKPHSVVGGFNAHFTNGDMADAFGARKSDDWLKQDATGSGASG